MSANRHRIVADTRFGTDHGATVRPLRPGDGRSPRTHQAPGLRQGAVRNAHRAGVRGVPQCSHGDVDHTPMKSWSDRGLQVLDLKAAGTLSSSAVTGATYTWSHTNMLALPCMHHAPSDWRSASTRQDSLTDMNPSTTRAGSLSNVARHRSRCAAAARRSESSAAATEKAATAHHRGRPRCSDKHSGHSGAMPAVTVGQSLWSAACS